MSKKQIIIIGILSVVIVGVVILLNVFLNPSAEAKKQESYENSNTANTELDVTSENVPVDLSAYELSNADKAEIEQVSSDFTKSISNFGADFEGDTGEERDIIITEIREAGNSIQDGDIVTIPHFKTRAEASAASSAYVSTHSELPITEDLSQMSNNNLFFDQDKIGSYSSSIKDVYAEDKVEYVEGSNGLNYPVVNAYVTLGYVAKIHDVRTPSNEGASVEDLINFEVSELELHERTMKGTTELQVQMMKDSPQSKWQVYDVSFSPTLEENAGMLPSVMFSILPNSDDDAMVFFTNAETKVTKMSNTHGGHDHDH